MAPVLARCSGRGLGRCVILVDVTRSNCSTRRIDFVVSLRGSRPASALVTDLDLRSCATEELTEIVAPFLDGAHGMLVGVGVARVFAQDSTNALAQLEAEELGKEAAPAGLFAARRGLDGDNPVRVVDRLHDPGATTEQE